MVAHPIGFFDHDHRVGASRHRRTRRDLGALPGLQGRRWEPARVYCLDTREFSRFDSACAKRALGRNRVAIHRSAIERRHITIRNNRSGEHPVDSLVQIDLFCPTERHRHRLRPLQGLHERNRLADRTHFRTGHKELFEGGLRNIDGSSRLSGYFTHQVAQLGEHQLRDSQPYRIPRPW